MKFTHKIEGLKNLERTLTKEIPKAVAPKVLRGALMDGLKPIVDAAKEKAPYDDDANGKGHQHLRDAISRSSRINKTGQGSLAAEAGLVMRSNKQRAGWRWHFIEFGTNPHIIRNRRRGRKTVLQDPDTKRRFGRKVRHPGTAAQPFLRPAWDEKIDEGSLRFRRRLRERIRKQLALRRRR